MYLLERSVGCRGSGGYRCQVCENRKIIDTFTSFTTKITIIINHWFDCNDECLIYLLNYKACGQLYTSRTTDHFRSGWNNYKSEAKKVESGNMENFKQMFI